MTEKKINYQFKLLYAFGIIFIVAGHCRDGGISIFYDWFTPYAFHLALFIFCSGYFYNKDNEKSICKSILHKVKTLLVPMYLWNLFYGILITILHQLGFTLAEPLTMYNLLIAPWIDGHQFAFNLAGWFVTPLFLVYVFNLLLRKLLSFIKMDNDYLIGLLYLILGMCGIYLAMHGYNKGVFVIVARMAYFIPFYGLGTLYRYHLEKRDVLPNIPYFALVMFAQLLIISHYRVNKSYVPSWGENYDSVIMPFFVGLLGILFWLRITRILSPLCEKSRTILLIADNTYSIMINQFFGFFLVNTLYNFAHMHLGVCNDFDPNIYYTNVWYFYFPYNTMQWCIIYLIAGVAVPIAMSLAITWAKTKLLSLLPQKK